MNKKKKNLNGAEIFFECLKREKVKVIFGYPGGATILIYEKLYDVDFLTHILAKHEQGATHMAEGYAKATGKVGVVLATSGPGATNTVTGIANAYLDSSPMVVFTGQVATHLIGNDAFQEADIVGITRPITKHNFLVRDVKDLASTIRKAFFIASTGRPGPVLVDLPKNMIHSTCEFEYPETYELRGYKPNYNGHHNQIKKAASVLKKAKRPVLYVGGGVIMSEGTKELRSFAKKNNLPVTMTLQGLGAYPGTDEQSLGMLGMHGTYAANMAVSNCDVLVALGARFDDRVTGKVDTFAVGAYKIHVDIDPASIDKNVLVDLPIVGDFKQIITEIDEAMDEKPETEDWWQQINEWKKAHPLNCQNENGELRAAYVVDRISNKTKGEAVIVTDVGQNQMWSAQHYKYENPRSHITSGGLGTMGFSVPAAIGASFGVKDRPIISISGDGGFQMNFQELITAVIYKIPVKFFILNNNYLGMVRQWQEFFHNKKYSATDLSCNPDFVKIAEAIGVPAFSTSSVDKVDDLLDRAFEINDGPVLVEFKIQKEDNVYPMVPAGVSISEMMLEKPKVRRSK